MLFAHRHRRLPTRAGRAASRQGAFLPEGQKMRGKKGRFFPEEKVRAEKVGGVSLSWQ